MPTYEYACTACGHAWEQVQRITEAPVELCPSCKQSAAHRLISATNFILKGGGWYSDLYSSPKPAEKKGEEGSNASSGSEKADAASKPATGDTSGGGSVKSPSSPAAAPGGSSSSGSSSAAPSGGSSSSGSSSASAAA